jgi:hypothetical protein
MSLVVAYVDSRSAAIGGDRRSITFAGSSARLEEELYSGSIVTDEDLLRRASELGTVVLVSDGRDKVWKDGDLLVGEVTELSIESQRRRRVYATPGGYLLVDIDGKDVAIRNRGKSALIVLGNRFTRSLAAERLRGARASRRLIGEILALASLRTASVSPDYRTFHTETRSPDPEGLLSGALRRDCKDNGWKVCGLE